MCMSAPARAATRKRQHPAKNPAAHLERLLKLFEILREYRRVQRSASNVVLKLLYEWQHHPERIVDVVRDAASQVRHRVLSLGHHDPGTERFGTVQVLNGDRCL